MFIVGRKMPVDLERFVSGSDSTGAEEGVMLSTFSVTSTSVCDSLLKNFQKIIWKGKGR